MDVLVQGIGDGFRLLISGDPAVWSVMLLSLRVSLTATLLCLVVGIPTGMALALSRFRGRSLLISTANTGMALPPVVAGLIVSLMLWRSGPFGSLGLLYTPAAMIIAQVVIALPIVIALTVASIQHLNPRLKLQILALGASGPQLYWLLAREAKLPLLAAVMAGFGAVISEVGASMMVGGNIVNQTRVLTTAVVLEVNRGQFANAVALSVLLLVLAFGVNLALTLIQQRRRPL
jgi:ABC-type tungstate transport system substrate-binding protein